MNHKLKIFIIFIIVLVLSFMLAAQTGLLYEEIIGRKLPGGWIGSCPECSEGFLISFAFLSGLLFFGFLNKKRINITVTFILIPSLLLLFARQGDAFLIALCFGLIGLGLGHLIYLIRKKLKLKKQQNS